MSKSSRTYLVVNAHGGGGTQAKKFANWYRQVEPDVGLVSELEKNANELRELGYHVLTGRITRGAKDCGIVIPNRHYRFVNDSYIKKITRNLNRPVAPARHLVNMKFKSRSVYSVHANAVIQEPTGGWKNWEVSDEWKHGMVKINSAVAADQLRGYHPILGGDLNWRDILTFHPIEFSPEWLVERRKLGYITTGVMWLMWDKRVNHLEHSEVIKGETIPTGKGDQHPHDALLTTLERNK